MTSQATSLHNSRIIGVTVLLAALLAGAFQLGRAMSGNGGHDQLTIRRVDLSTVTDFSNDRKLIGFADNVFFGRVSAQVGQRGSESLPETQFKVDVLETIKGTLSGQVVVNQQGGHLRSTNELVLVGGDALLEPGTTYLFATKSYKATGWHTLIPEHGDVRVASVQSKDALGARFKRAATLQIPFRAGAG